ncbi:thioester-containing protein 1 allele R1-like [Anticarsia gemmatalis]|uniref:thioester-containing protein 1 allele R1-like n=1 Tax=Anticarsia gemmatalis TaxID=129554 RepID=UPI003F75BF32
MAGKLRLIILLVALIAPLAVQCISIVGPRILRPYSAYTVAIGGGSRAYTLYVAVEGRRANGEQYNEGREVQIPAAASRLIELEIGDPGPGQYALVARSTSGPLFSSSAPLLYQPRSFCIFVQTDKRVYQPGDTINFRVIALDKYLLPLSTTVDVSILDTGGSPIRQWAGAELDRGVLTQELALADEPALGEWTIQVEARGQKYSHHVLVADYVQPRFNMHMHLPSEVLFSEGRFDINVTAKHFNGLPVRGELTISAYPVFFSGLLQPVVAAPTRKVVEINGQTEVTFDLKTDLDLAEDAARPLVVEAVLEEKDTLIKQNISSRILLLRAPYRLRVSAPTYFKPTLPYIVQIELVDSSGELMSTDGEVTVERLWDDGAPANETKVPLNKGVASYTVVPDRAHVNSTLNLLIKYKEVTERVVNVQRSEYTSQFLTAEVLTRDTGVGGEMRARITATEPMDMVHYAVIGRGDIIVAKTLELSPARKSVDVTVAITSRMAPGCILLAWYPRLDAARNNLLAAAVYAPQKNLLQNDISVSPVSSNGATLKPNTLIELKVLGESGAIVGLLAEDVHAIEAGLAQANGLGSGLDLHKIEREVETFNSLSHSVFKNDDHLTGSGLNLGGYTASDVFKNAGVVILTDGVVIRNNPDGSVPTQAPIETGTRAPLAGPYAFSRLPPPPSPRYYLTVSPQPTWMLANLTVGNDGNGAKERWTSETSGEFAIGAFSVHPTLGLGLASPQKFATSVPLAITAELPASLQRGETVAAVIILKTTLAVDTSVEVTFYNSDQYFEFEPLENELESTKKIELFKRVRVTIPARGSASTAFLLSVVRTGEAPVIVEANGNGVSASLFRTIDVKDGYEEDVWAWSLLDARRTVARANVTLDVRPGVKTGAISLRATGDLLAAALQATKSPPAPSADPTYALRPLALSCVLLDYLQATGQEESSTTQEARALAAVGYQRLMAYRRPDGSFAAETDSEAEGDVWMTAVAARWLSRCSRYVSVEARAARDAATWLARAQQQDGAWSAPPPRARTDPHAQAPLPLTAQALVALHHAKGSDVLYKNNINKALDFIARGVSPDLDAYTLAVIGGALATARHPQLTQTLEIMNKYANTSGSTLFWSRTLSGNEWRNPWLVGNSLEATTAAWGLRAMMAARLLDEATPVVRYLLQAYQPNDPDPEVIDSLAQFAETIRTATKLRVSVNVTGSEEARQFQIAENNALVIQTQSIRNSRSVSAVTEGRGIALVGLSAKGSTNVTAPWPRFTLDPRVDQVSTKDRLQLSVCFGYVPQGNETESGLALLTVQLPSGYSADITTLTELTSVRYIVWARVSKDGSRVLAAVRTVPSERCATLAAPRALPVARQRPAWATLVDLYDSSHRARIFYQTQPATACDVCREWESCARACGTAALQVSENGQTNNRPAPAAASLFTPTVFLTLITTALILLI